MVVLQKPKERRRRGMVGPDVESFDALLDAAHTAMLIFDEDGAKACERWLRQRGLDRDATLRGVLQAMANAIPVTRKKEKRVRPEIDLLGRMNDALSLGIKIPAEEALAPLEEQMRLPHTAVAEDESEHSEDDEDGDEG